MIATCKCSHASQDSIHGPKGRVFNPKAKKDKQPQVYRCSVCGAEREAPASAVKEVSRG